MSIKEIKDIKKLQKRLKLALDEIKYLKKCCENAGEELAKHSFAYDYKEKNLVIQALQLNEKFERKEQECEELKAQLNDMACMDDDNVLCYPRQEFKKECDRYEQALDTVSEYIKDNCNSCQGIKYGGCDKCEIKQIKEIISKAKDGK